MTKAGEKPAKSTPVSKKKKSEDTPEPVDWVVEDFAKDLEYFHKVIGLPNVGTIPKDITAEDVPLAELEKHFGVKAKNDKNGYKKEGVKGIPAEDIHKLVIALDGIEKFQLYSLEIARGLYYERILKRAVNWAACGEDKHKGQLAWRLRRNAPAQVDLPPWKHIEHKYTMPSGLEVTVGEEQCFYTPAKSQDKCETPGEGRKARKASDVAPAEVKSENECQTPGEGRKVRKASDVAPAEVKSENECETPGEGRKARKASDVSPVQGPLQQGTLVASTSTPMLLGEAVQRPLEQEQRTHAASTSEEPIDSSSQHPDNAGSEDCKIVENFATVARHSSCQDPDNAGSMKADGVEEGESNIMNEKPLQDHLDSTFKQVSDHLSGGTKDEDGPAENEYDNWSTDHEDDTGAKWSPTFKDSGKPEETSMPTEPAPKIESFIKESQIFDDRPPKPESFNEVTGTLIPERKDLLVKSCLDLLERNLQELCLQVEMSNLDMAGLTARMEANSKLLQGIEEEVDEFTNTMNTCKAEVAQFRQRLEEKAAEKNQIESDMTLLGDDELIGGVDQGINDGYQAKLVLCCSETNALQEAMNSSRQRHANALTLANSKLPEISKCDDADNSMQEEMLILKKTAARLTGSQIALRAEWSRLKNLLGKGLVHVVPFSMICPLQSEESYFPITECPVCTLGFFCNNWVPTPCGHCYHPNCLFSLLRVDDHRVPKCYACSEVFHPAWLECWGLPQVNHPEVVKLVDDWGLADQARTFRESLCDLYTKSAFNIGARRKAQAAKHKKVTKLYSMESVKKSTQYHETVGRAALINHCVPKAESKGDWSVGSLEAKKANHGILRVGTESGENSPRETVETGDDLQGVQNLLGNVEGIVVNIEKGAAELRSTANIIKKPIQYHETAGRAELIKHGVMTAESKGDHTIGPSEETGDDLQKLKSWPLDLSNVKKEKGAPELGSTVECISSAGQKDLDDTPSKQTKRKRKGTGETSKEGKDVGTTGQSKVSGETRTEETVNVGTTSKRRKGSGEIGKEGKDVGTTVQSPTRLKLRAGTIAQNTLVPPSTMSRRSKQSKK